jgi:hypothetical protein
MTLVQQDAMIQTKPLTESGDMDVRDGIRSVRRYLLAVGAVLALGASTQADPIYSVIDLGAGSVTYGSSGGNGTVIGSNGLTYIFNSDQGQSWPQGIDPSQGVPIIAAPPVGSPDTYGNPAYAYSHSTLVDMNRQGLAVGLDDFGVAGHIDNSEAFAVQRQPDGSWGMPIALWAGEANFGRAAPAGILGISPGGQILGFGYNMGLGPGYDAPAMGYGLFLYDAKTQSFTNLSTLIGATQSAAGPNWFLNGPTAKIDDQGRILIVDNAYAGYPGTAHSLLLVPQGTPTDMTAAPEPATWAIFSLLIGGWAARRRLRSRRRPRAELRDVRAWDVISGRPGMSALPAMSTWRL